MIVVVNAFNPYALDTLKYCLELSAKGTVNSKLKDFYPTVKKGIPWLVLVNFKGEPLVRCSPPLHIHWTRINLGFSILI